MHALKVPKRKAEKVKLDLIEKDNLDAERLAESDEKYVYLPIKDKFHSEYEIVDKELEKKREESSFETEMQGLLDKEEMELLKTSQDIIGDIAIIEISEELSHKEKEIAEALLRTKPYIKTVLRKGKHEGEYRVQQLKWLAGKKTKETIHKENNARIKIDVEKSYFSPRLATERKRITEQVKEGEELLVMFSGAAPYPCVIARNTSASKVVGVEINPDAHQYGLENVKLNKLKNVELYQGDVAEVVPKLGKFDRIVMPAPHNASEYLELAGKHVKKGGIIHYYDFLEEEDMEEQARINLESLRREYEILDIVKCGQVSAGTYRICVDLKAL